MFWFLHYAVKVGIGLALAGMILVAYVNRHWFAPADAWVQTLRRTQTETLPIVAESTGRVARAVSGDTLSVRVDGSRAQSIRVAGILAPSYARNPLSDEAKAYRRSRDYLASITVSNAVRIAYTFVTPEGGGGIGGVYLGPTNVALPMLSAGLVIVHEPSLRSLPMVDQVQLLAAEKAAREGRVGFWSDMTTLEALQEGSGAGIQPGDGPADPAGP
jgi:endonuclease YncB( thermonuclease family)